jgi:hypothetical protein
MVVVHPERLVLLVMYSTLPESPTIKAVIMVILYRMLN